VALTRNQISRYQKTGYLLKKQLFPQELMNDLMAEIENLHEEMADEIPSEVLIAWEDNNQNLDTRRIRQLLHSEFVSPIINEMSRAVEMLDIVEQLMGPNICLSSSKLMMKAAREGSGTPWHQDWAYWREGHRKPLHVNCFLAIDSATDKNGAIRFVEGSHLKGLTGHHDSGSKWFDLDLGHDMAAYKSKLVEMEPGDAIFFGPLIIHGSGANLSPKDRRMNTFVFDRPNNLINGQYPQEKYLRIINSN